jgi:DNA-binding NarL/FixJ family response regulator
MKNSKNESNNLKKITIVILEDNATLVKGMLAELDKPDMKVCGFSDTVDQFLEDINKHQPDVAIVDLRIWGDFTAGKTGIKKAIDLSPDTAFMIHTAYDDMDKFHEGITLGIKAFISKNIYEKPVDEIVRIVCGGGTYYGDFLPAYLEMVKESGTRLAFEKEEQENVKDILTSTEQGLMQLLEKGYSLEEIAETKSISIHTVKAHTKNIRAKLGVKTTSDAILKYRLIKNS